MRHVPLSQPPRASFGDEARRDVAQRRYDRLERGLPWVTLALVVLLIGMYAYSLLLTAAVRGPSVLPGDGVLTRLGARVASKVAAQPWRLLSCALLHAGPLHLALNTLAILGLGRITETVWGPGRSLGLFVTTALTGSLLSQVMGVPRSVGASGAAFGLMGACLVYGWRHRGRLPEPLDTMLGRELGVWVLLNLVIGALFGGIIDQWAHIGGLVGGMLLSVGLGGRLDPLEHPRPAVGWLLGLGGAAALAWALLRALLR